MNFYIKVGFEMHSHDSIVYNACIFDKNNKCVQKIIKKTKDKKIIHIMELEFYAMQLINNNYDFGADIDITDKKINIKSILNDLSSISK